MNNEHFRHPISSYRHRLGYDRRDCTSMGLIRSIRFYEEKIIVHCLQSGIESYTKFNVSEFEQFDFYQYQSLTLARLQEELDGCRGRADLPIELFGEEFEELERLYQELFDDLEEIMKTNEIYSEFNYDLLITRHYLGQMVSATRF